MPRRAFAALLLAAAIDVHAAERFLTSPTISAVNANYGTAAIASDGSSFLAAWVAMPFARTASVMVQRLDGAALPAAVVTDPKLRDARIEMAWSNGSYLLVWNIDNTLHSMRLGRDGQPIGADHVLAQDLRNAAIASNGATTFLVARAGWDLVTLTLDANDNVVKQTPLWNGSITGYGYDVAARDGGFAVGVADSAAGVFAMRFDLAGNAVDTKPIAVSPNDAGVYRPLVVAVASRGGDTLIVWSAVPLRETGIPLFAAVVSPSGDVGTRVSLTTDSIVEAIDVTAGDDRYEVLVTGSPYESAGPMGILEEVDLLGSGASIGHRTLAIDRSISAGHIAHGTPGFGIVWIDAAGLDPSNTIRHQLSRLRRRRAVAERRCHANAPFSRHDRPVPSRHRQQRRRLSRSLDRSVVRPDAVARRGARPQRRTDGRADGAEPESLRIFAGHARRLQRRHLSGHVDR